MADKIEGATNKCQACGEITVCRMTTYADFPNKLQWQNNDNTKAHYDKTGKCKKASQVTTQGTLEGGENPSQGTIEGYVPRPAQGTAHPLESPTKEKEPTPEDLMRMVENANLFSSEIFTKIIDEATEASMRLSLQKAAIEKVMNKAGIKHPSRVSFMTEVMRRLS